MTKHLVFSCVRCQQDAAFAEHEAEVRKLEEAKSEVRDPVVGRLENHAVEPWIFCGRGLCAKMHLQSNRRSAESRGGSERGGSTVMVADEKCRNFEGFYKEIL